MVAAGVAADPPECQEAARIGKRRQWQDALRILNELLIQYPGNPKVLNLEGLALTGAGKTTEARGVFEKALHYNPKFSPALKNLSIVEWKSGAPEAMAHTEAACRNSAIACGLIRCAESYGAGV